MTTLTLNQIIVMRGLARGKSLRRIASDMEISISSVRTFRNQARDKLQAYSQVDAVAKFEAWSKGQSEREIEWALSSSQ